MFPERKLSLEAGADAVVLSKRFCVVRARGRFDAVKDDLAFEDVEAKELLHLVLSVLP